MNTALTALNHFMQDDRGSIALEYMLTGMVSGGATAFSANLIKDGLSKLAEQSQSTLEIMLYNVG
jgi:hypothetical protein